MKKLSKPVISGYLKRGVTVCDFFELEINFICFVDLQFLLSRRRNKFS